MGSTDNFLPGNVNAAFVADASAAARVPDSEAVEVAEMDEESPTFVGAGTGSEDTPSSPTGVGDGATDVGTEDVVAGTAVDDTSVDVKTDDDEGESGLGVATDTVQVLTSRTASFPCSSVIGVRVMTQVWVTGPEAELIV